MLSLKPLLSELTIKTEKLGYKKLDIDFISEESDADWGGDFGWAQRQLVAEIERQYNSRQPVRIIVLKARRLGISTIAEGTLYWWCKIHPGTSGMVIAHRATSSNELFEMTKLFEQSDPLRDYFDLKYETKFMLHWEEPLRSRLQVATAKNVEVARAFTLQALHASEVAFWPDAETLWTGMYQSIPTAHGTIVIVESTANGRGNFFHNLWLSAEEGEVDFKPLFFPWWKHNAYRRPTHLTIKAELSVEERELHHLGATMEHIEWRRWAIGNKVRSELAFMQEYPSTPEEAFVTSGQPLFSHIHLRKCFEPKKTASRGRLIDDPRSPKGVRFQSDPEGPLTLFLAPNRRASSNTYFAAVDPTETVGGDAACIQVINRATLEQVAVWHGHQNPRFIAYELMRLGYFYNTCELTSEIDGGGQVVIDLIVHNYRGEIWRHRRADTEPGRPSRLFGWATNYARKRWSIGLLQSCVLDGSLKIHDRVTYNQMLNFVNDDGYWGDRSEAKGRGDDAVMSLAMALICSHTEDPVVPGVGSNVYETIYDQEWGDHDGEPVWDPPPPRIRRIVPLEEMQYE